jgi:hypothetical protein
LDAKFVIDILLFGFYVILCSVPIPPRKISKKIPARGLFPEAKVVRGQDWIWGNQDGEHATLTPSLKLAS